MKIKLLLFFLLCYVVNANAQCEGPPPAPGLNYLYALDTDNDGFAIFDIQYFIDHVSRPRLESHFGISSSGYNAIFTNHYGVAQTLLYTNTVQNESCGVYYVYSGSGPEFQELPPCYRPIYDYMSHNATLITVPYNGDVDNDGILNIDEDTNHNLNLMDDDDDSDGLINLKDATNDLATVQHTAATINVYPNPVTDGVINFDSNVVIASVTIYDVTGKQVSESKINGTTLNISTLKQGIYFLKFDTVNGNTYKKIAVR